LARLSLVCAVFLAVMAVRGPGMFWLIFWTRPALRTVMVVAVVALLLWTICGAWRVSSRQLTSRVRGSGSVLVAGGAVLLAMGIVPAIAGLEAMLTGLNNQMAILPMGLSMILGITEHLGIPDTLPRTMMIVGGACGLCGLLVLLVWRRRLPQLARKSRPGGDRHKYARHRRPGRDCPGKTAGRGAARRGLHSRTHRYRQHCAAPSTGKE